jgi:RNA-directed DNA polymerase
LNSDDGKPPGFTFLGFDIVQKEKRLRQRAVFTKRPSNQKFITLITTSKEGVKRHRLQLKDIIQKSRGINQERLIQKLNPIIRGWALSKRTQISSKTFQAIDQYVYLHLWKWARKRHPKMSRYKLKEKYWHKVGSRNWVFGVKRDDTVSLQLQMHSKITIKRFAKVKGTASPFDGNLIYWAKRSGKSPIIPDIKAKLIKEQNGRCGICKKAFLPDNIIERDHIVPKALEGKEY